MLSCLQELHEEEMLLWVKAALHEQLTHVKVEELVLQSMPVPTSGMWPQRTPSRFLGRWTTRLMSTNPNYG
uniref:Uncharacterized protein n=1 Tax=Pavo cristatus TaxID=9049 RepID=A0A8C9G104_PAVCR